MYCHILIWECQNFILLKDKWETEILIHNASKSLYVRVKSSLVIDDYVELSFYTILSLFQFLSSQTWYSSPSSPWQSPSLSGDKERKIFTYSLLPITYCLLPIICYLLPVTCYLLPVTCYLLSITYFQFIYLSIWLFTYLPI